MADHGRSLFAESAAYGSLQKLTRNVREFQPEPLVYVHLKKRSDELETDGQRAQELEQALPEEEQEDDPYHRHPSNSHLLDICLLSGLGLNWNQKK